MRCLYHKNKSKYVSELYGVHQKKSNKTARARNKTKEMKNCNSNSVEISITYIVLSVLYRTSSRVQLMWYVFTLYGVLSLKESVLF